MSGSKPGSAVLLVYSGGLDTSICIPMMREDYGYSKVITVTVNVGQPQEDLAQAEEKAKILKTEHYTIDAREEFVRDYCFRSLKANGEYQGYPMSTSIARPLISAKAVEVAQKLGVKAFAHGCTGRGNDQYRIEYGMRALMPDAVIHAPIRERNLTRSWEIEYAQKKGIPIQQSVEKIWSIDENLWGRSIEGGRLEDPSYEPPEEIFLWTKKPENAAATRSMITIQFDKGVPVAVNGQKQTPAQLVIAMNEWAGSNGIGRIDIMEDRLLGLKVRENYECPAATVLLKAHAALESLVLTREENRFKKVIDQEWSRIAYEGLWWDPLKEDLEAFIDQTQSRVTGEVRLWAYRGGLQVCGRTSPWALYREDVASFDGAGFDQRESTGSVKNFGLQSRMYLQLKSELGGPQ